MCQIISKLSVKIVSILYSLPYDVLTSSSNKLSVFDVTCLSTTLHFVSGSCWPNTNKIHV